MIVKFFNLKNIEMFMKSYLLGCVRLEETVNHRNINWNSLTHNVFLFEIFTKAWMKLLFSTREVRID